ncbi:hypothetical protein [Fluviicola chungangensis]|uniref:Uncharacterized protein n=1 Tax=Fluviicola chungangensis TaxID=2597671 RepID=A0A556N397_9FLAO|nr:hypothetical protein [Fluviicola chungangensis]TSJ46640.1 hypothetical protein FO442_05635 [Fluviicola chungangensis]
MGKKNCKNVANQYNLGNSKVIFSLMGIPDEESNLETYYKLIEQGADLKQYDSTESISRKLLPISSEPTSVFNQPKSIVHQRKSISNELMLVESEPTSISRQRMLVESQPNSISNKLMLVESEPKFLFNRPLSISSGRK